MNSKISTKFPVAVFWQVYCKVEKKTKREPVKWLN